MQSIWYILIGIIFHSFISAAQMEQSKANPTTIRIVPVNPTAESETTKTVVVFPRLNEIVNDNPVSLQIRIEGFPFGTDTDVPRSSEIYNDPDGQCLHVFIDNHPYFIINEALVDTLDDKDNYYVQVAQLDIPFNLDPGMHVIRALPVRSFNEGLKGDTAYTASVFYLKTKKNNPGMNLNKPYLTYNEPQGDYDYSTTQPVLLDFHISNCELSKDGYKVRLTIDGTVQRTLTDWVPYYIYGLKPGKHKIRLELLDPENSLVSGVFNSIQREIVISK